MTGGEPRQNWQIEILFLQSRLSAPRELPEEKLLDRHGCLVVMSEQGLRLLCSVLFTKSTGTRQDLLPLLGEIKVAPSALSLRREEILLKGLDRYELLTVTPVQGLSILPLKKFRMSLETLQDCSELLG